MGSDSRWSLIDRLSRMPNVGALPSACAGQGRRAGGLASVVKGGRARVVAGRRRAGSRARAGASQRASIQGGIHWDCLAAARWRLHLHLHSPSPLSPSLAGGGNLPASSTRESPARPRRCRAALLLALARWGLQVRAGSTAAAGHACGLIQPPSPGAATCHPGRQNTLEEDCGPAPGAAGSPLRLARRALACLQPAGMPAHHPPPTSWQALARSHPPASGSSHPPTGHPSSSHSPSAGRPTHRPAGPPTAGWPSPMQRPAPIN